MKKFFSLSFMALTLSLTACFGGGPSESEVSELIKQAALEQVDAQMSLMPNNSVLKAQFEKQRTAIENMEVNVDEITEDENGVYVAVVTLENDGRMMQQNIRFKEGKNGWVVLQ